MFHQVRSEAVAISTRSEFAGILGRSESMRELFARVERLAPTPLSTLILGETGTGKELFAQAIHDHSGREGPFVVLDCAALPANLAESMILGHSKGAFTGATEDRAGLVEAAHGGSLFLDEVGELPPDLQPKLLRVLESRSVQRLGEPSPRPVDVRIIAATNVDLSSMVAENRFRLDLYQRLAQATLRLPPLRERTDDIPLLAAKFVRAVELATGSDRHLTPTAVEALKRRQWPGNVRELKNAVEYAAYLATAPELTKAMVAPDTTPEQPLVSDGVLCDLPLKAASEEFQRRYCAHLLATSPSFAAAARRADYTKQGFRALLHRIGLLENGDGATET